MDAVNCSCVVSAHFGTHQVRLLIKFPGQYPNNSAPAFQFISPTSISAAMKTKIHKVAYAAPARGVAAGASPPRPHVPLLPFRS